MIAIKLESAVRLILLVLLISGSALAAQPIELADVAAGNGGFVINGTDVNDQSGFSVSGAGDVNGDGLDDLIVGAWLGDPGGDANAGESYVVFGKADTSAMNLASVAAGVGGFVINGIDPNDNAGFSVSGAGDVNGDRLADLIVGAQGADPGGDNGAGESYVVFGKADTAVMQLVDVAAGVGGFIINGIDAEDSSGWSVSGAGDVNGDGLEDLIVGAHGAGDGGQGYVIFGKASTAPVDLASVAAGVGGFVINGIDVGDQSGWSASGAGDVNGDGLADLIVGAWSADPGGVTGAGESYVVFGKTDTSPVDLADVAARVGGGFVMNGIDANDFSGYSVAGAGDVNGDGLADLIIGALLADANDETGAGESYVVFGKAGVAPVELADIAAGAGGGFAINGIGPNDSSGASVSGAGDVNGDGLADVIVGAPAGNPGGDNDAGESYVVFGKTDTAPVDPIDVVPSPWGGFVIKGIDVGDNAGFSVAGAGDVNGDGRADLIVGAQVADPGGVSNAGESYVVFAPVPCPADVDGSGDIGFGDLTQILIEWGPCPPPCPWDLDASGDVGFGDMTIILRDWGPCDA